MLYSTPVRSELLLRGWLTHRLPKTRLRRSRLACPLGPACRNRTSDNAFIMMKGHFPEKGGRVSRYQGRKGKLNHNAVKNVRERLLMSKAELARKAGVSPITVDRVEKGMDCRMETKRKIILALGLDLSDKEKVFPAN